MPRVLFAHQAPTLIDNVAASPLWDVSVVDLGDSAGFDERKLLNTKPGTTAGADWVFVCSPEQLRQARGIRGVKVCWVLHNGKEAPVKTLLKSGAVHRIACMSQRNADQIRAWFGTSVPISVLRPSYEPAMTWEWIANVSWTIKSRPWARDQRALELVHRVIREARAFDHRWYGQGQPNGFIMPGEKAALMRCCSCYVSCLPEWAGFGLTEHECMAAGVPVVGSRWGDTTRMTSQGMLHDDISVQIEYLNAARRMQAYICDVQFQYLRDVCSPAMRDRSIEEFLNG
jgi:hypothetical protein